ncbi:RING-14 protein [Cryomyces antarcticus]
MKFGHQYSEALQQAGFPSHWANSAISYRQLKKCIKRVEKELSQLGLDKEIMNELMKSFDEDALAGEVAEHQAEGISNMLDLLASHADGKPTSGSTVLQPKLLFAVDPETGEPLNACLSPETKTQLQQLAIREKLTSMQIFKYRDDGVNGSSTTFATVQRRHTRARRMIEVPLTSDAEFFTILENGLTDLETLQAREQDQLSKSIEELGSVLRRVAEPPRTLHRRDRNRWREIFQLYMDSAIFFSTNELDHGERTYEDAKKRLEHLSAELEASGVVQRFKKRDSRAALDQFMQINWSVLQNMHFHELNLKAMSKILKKFDKRTAFGVATTFPSALAPKSVLTQHTAKAICYQVSKELIPIVPLVEPYTCPVCYGLAWRPIKLHCGHIFCIMCCIRMQEEGRRLCPMCRQDVVMRADFDNLDHALADFLWIHFRKEIDAKRRENSEAEGPGLMGGQTPDLAGPSCTVM